MKLEGERGPVALGLDHPHVAAQGHALALERHSRPRVDRQHDRAVGSRNDLEQSRPAADRGRLPVLGPMDGGEQVLARAERDRLAVCVPKLERLEHRRVTNLGEDASGEVLHQVADLDHPFGDALGCQVCDGSRRRREQPPAQVVSDNPVDLLGHPPVERAQPGLNVRDGIPARGPRAPASVEFVSP